MRSLYQSDERVLFIGGSPAVSPDGTSCVFLADRANYRYDLRLHDLKTNNSTWLTDSREYKSYPSFMNHEEILFVSEPTADGTGMLKIINWKTGELRELCSIK